MRSQSEFSGVELPGVHRILVRAEDVEVVELMKTVSAEEESCGRSKGTVTAAFAQYTGSSGKGEIGTGSPSASAQTSPSAAAATQALDAGTSG